MFMSMTNKKIICKKRRNKCINSKKFFLFTYHDYFLNVWKSIRSLELSQERPGTETATVPHLMSKHGCNFTTSCQLAFEACDAGKRRKVDFSTTEKKFYGKRAM